MSENEQPKPEKDGEESVAEEKGKALGKKIPKEKYEKALEDLEKALADRDHWKNEYYRAYADTQNLRKSLEAESRDAVRYRAEGFLKNLLPALDGFHMALANEPSSQELRNYLVGFQYIYNQIQKVLEDEGVKEVSPKQGDVYDLNSMHAVDNVETEETKPGTVYKVYAKGYRLHDRLIRPAMVAIAKEPAPKPEQPAEPKPEEAGKDPHQA